MKYKIITFLILGFSSNSFSNSISEMNLPKWVKGVSFYIEPKSDSNIYQINESILNEELLDPNDGILKTSLGLKTKMLFKPMKKYILINTLKADGVMRYFSNVSDNFIRDEYSLSNSLVGVIPVSKKWQIGHLLYVGANQSQSFEYRDEDGSKEINSIENDHLNYSATLFTSFKFNKSWKTSLDLGVNLLDFRQDYSSYTSVKGEENDSLQRSAKLNNQFKLGKVAVLDTPLSYSKSFFRNRSALDSTGAFSFEGIVPRDLIEKISFLPKLTINTPVGSFSTSFGLTNQKDLVFGGRSYDGTEFSLGYSVNFLNNHNLSFDYSESIHSYLSAGDFFDSSNELRQDKVSSIAIDYKLKEIFKSSFDFNLNYTYLDSNNGSFGGSFDSNALSSKLTYNL